MKKWLPLVGIIMTLMVASALPVFSQALDEFTDVPGSHEYAEAIYYLRDNNVVEGYADGSYKPDDTINRVEFLKIVAGSTFNSEYIEDCDLSILDFPDVDVTQWYGPTLCAGFDAGLVGGYPDGTFAPDNNIKFVEAAKIISNSQEYPVDVSLEPWYRPYVENLDAQGAIPLAIVSFDREITRGEMSEMMYRIHADVENKDGQTYESILGGVDANVGAYLYMFTGNVDAWMDDDYIYVDSNGIPEHETGDFPNPGNPNTISAQNYSLRITRSPEVSEAQTPIKIPGIAVNGVLMDPGTAEVWNNDPNSGWNYEAIQKAIDLGLDMNNAHVQPSGAYHYHGIPEGIIEGLDPETDSFLVGFAADGFPIYARYGVDLHNPDTMVKEMKSSWQLKEGERPNGPAGSYDGTFTQDYEFVEGSGDLDECNGTFSPTDEYPLGTYAYYLTDEFPFIPRCVSGEPDESFMSLQNAGGGPPGGGPGGGGQLPPPPL